MGDSMKKNNLDTDDVRGLVWRLALPSMAAQFVNVLYSIVDRIYIGNIEAIGDVALAGVGVCGPIVTLISSVAFLVGIGGAPLLSIRMGARDEQGARRVLANAFLMLMVFSGILTVFAYGLKNNMLHWFGASEGIFPYADEYMTVYLAGTAFALISAGMNQFVICQGYAKTGMATVFLGAALNIFLDPIFIFALNMGVKGAALATVISQCASALFAVLFLLSRKIPVRLTFFDYRWEIMKRILVMGLGPFLIIAFDNVLIIALNRVLRQYGGSQADMLLTCNAILQSFMLIITMPLSGITGGTQTILGYNIGAGRPDRILKAIKCILCLCLLFTTIMFLFSNFAPWLFVQLFTRDPQKVQFTVWMIRQYTWGVIPLAVQYELVDSYTGMGMPKFSVFCSTFRKVLYLGSVFIIPRISMIEHVVYAEPISDILGTAMTVTVFFLFVRKQILAVKNSGAPSKAELQEG